jgi:hypothetical protein
MVIFITFSGLHPVELYGSMPNFIPYSFSIRVISSSVSIWLYYVKWPFLASTGWLRITLLVFFTFLVVKIGKRIKKS